VRSRPWSEAVLVNEDVNVNVDVDEGSIEDSMALSTPCLRPGNPLSFLVLLAP
jgi:hypothetical protein